ncbi:MAG: urate hydroxylase PuuD, partial [Rhodospirillales bacterium]|nr:urate hydroxylase PuuD [Rhodospirillales bacterium]
MDIAFADWFDLIFRWLHLITGIAWIGSSFYFIFLDLSLRKKRELPPGVGGEAWNVHGGGFYLMQKYTVAPAEMPEELHWFKYEAYFTFLSGFALMSVIYYWGADTYLIDPEIADLTRLEAIALSIGFLAGGWIVYDILCRLPLLIKHDLLLSVAVFALICLVAVGTTHVFS